MRSKPEDTQVEPVAELPAEPPVAAAPSGLLKVRLRPGCGRDEYTDSATHLVVTAEWQEVEARWVGAACRREVDVEIQEV